MLGILTGLRQEALLIRSVFPQVPLALSGASEEGAVRAMEHLRRAGVTKVLSFGCAGGLSPQVEPGTIIVADYVHVESVDYTADDVLSRFCGAEDALRGGVLHSNHMIASAESKRQLHDVTKCLAVDMESGIVARSGLAFAVLRVVCDDVERDLPPAARDAMQDGRIHVPALIRSLMRHPKQIPALIGLGREASRARSAMSNFLQAHKETLEALD